MKIAVRVLEEPTLYEGKLSGQAPLSYGDLVWGRIGPIRESDRKCGREDQAAVGQVKEPARCLTAEPVTKRSPRLPTTARDTGSLLPNARKIASNAIARPVERIRRTEQGVKAPDQRRSGRSHSGGAPRGRRRPVSGTSARCREVASGPLRTADGPIVQTGIDREHVGGRRGGHAIGSGSGIGVVDETGHGDIPRTVPGRPFAAPFSNNE